MLWLKPLFELLCGLLGYATEQTRLRNTPEMQAGRKAQIETEEKSRMEKAVAKRDEKEIRNILAE